MGRLAFIPVGERPYALNVQTLANQFVRLDVSEPSQVLAYVISRSSLYDRIRERQYNDPHLLVLKDTVQHGDAKDVTIGDDGKLRMHGRICVPNVDGLLSHKNIIFWIRASPGPTNHDYYETRSKSMEDSLKKLDTTPKSHSRRKQEI
ncbi:uncharacterized protein [Nicotiana tomentosiformis]|uniref:uncharacterized protein n=1 Tax=Nicotiana tomentosiformis TaxID=4098 RepID=UPI00388C56EC